MMPKKRPLSLAIVALVAVTFVAGEVSAQAQGHDHGGDGHSHEHHHGSHRGQEHAQHDGQHGHSHARAPVACELATPPWRGLSSRDLDRVGEIEASVAHLTDPEAARAAGFRPAFGNIPTMGVHWIHPDRSREGFRLEEPDHLMFAPVAGEERLVGVAYAFTGPLDAETPEAFESELAHWHDHPQLGGPGQTLHMIHVWTVPSPYGPFAGNNYLLPFYGAGVEAPDPCWISGEEHVERFEQTGMTLALLQLTEGRRDLGVIGAIARNRPGLEGMRAATQVRLDDEIEALDEAARAGDREAWEAAADQLLAARTPVQAQMAEALRRGLTEVQLSSDQRDQIRRGGPGAFRGGMP